MNVCVKVRTWTDPLNIPPLRLPSPHSPFPPSAPHLDLFSLQTGSLLQVIADRQLPDTTSLNTAPQTQGTPQHLTLNVTGSFNHSSRCAASPCIALLVNSLLLSIVRVRPPTSWEQDRLPEPAGWNETISIGDGNLASPRKLANKSLRSIVQVMDDHILIFDPKDQDVSRAFEQRGFVPPGSKRYKDQRYTFDRVFDEQAQQIDVFEQTTRPLLDGLLDGFNATVFAYGVRVNRHHPSNTLSDRLLSRAGHWMRQDSHHQRDGD